MNIKKQSKTYAICFCSKGWQIFNAAFQKVQKKKKAGNLTKSLKWEIKHEYEYEYEYVIF